MTTENPGKQDTDPGRHTDDTESADPREKIAQTRKELGDTVAALAAKADVREQVRLRAQRTGAGLSAAAGRLRARTRAFTTEARRSAAADPASARRALAAGGAVLTAAFLAVTGWRRRRARQAALRNRPAWARAGDRLRGSVRVARIQVRSGLTRSGRTRRLRRGR